MINCPQRIEKLLVRPGYRYSGALIVGLMLIAGMIDVCIAEDSRRGRGGYGSYDEPANWPTLEVPDVAASSSSHEAPVVDAELGLKRAKVMLGRDVVSQDGVLLGQVRAVVLEKQSQALRVVVALGGRFGFGRRKVVLPPAGLKPESAEEDSRLVLASDEGPELLLQRYSYHPEQFDVLEPSLTSNRRG